MTDFLKKNLFKLILTLAGIVIIICGVLTYNFLQTCMQDLPSIEELEEYKPKLSTKIFDINGKLVDEFFIERRAFVHLKDLPPNLINAIIATEDSDFYGHWGISPMGILRALIKDFAHGKFVQGGSTITQQVSKTLFLTSEKKISRKIKEVILAVKFEQRYSKNEILEIYLNHIYFGHGVYGIQLASELYFGKSPTDLNLEECALLAGLPKAPEYYSPYKNPEAAIARRNTVIKRLLKDGFITKGDYENALEKPTNVLEKFSRQRYASYFVEYIRQKLEPYYGDVLYKGGLRIYTTLDLDMQIAAVNAFEDNLAKFDAEKLSKIQKFLETKKITYPDDDLKIYASTEAYKNVQGSVIALDPKTGQIRALVGGRNFKQSQFNRATQAKRQPGSSFKTIIFTAAIDQKIPPNTILDDSPVVYYNNGIDWQLVGKNHDLSDLPQEIKDKLRKLEDMPEYKDKAKRKKQRTPYDPLQIWMPGNYSHKYLGNITMRQALENSVNIAVIKLLEQVTSKVGVEYTQKLGIKSSVSPYLSMALGTFVVTPLELTNAYATLANNGIRTEPYAIIKICDNQGNILEEHSPEETAVLSEETSYVVTNLLRGVINNGTGMRAKALGRPAAGKTGTTNDYSDAWFIAYTPELVASVWVGYDDQKTLGRNQTGGKLSASIWLDFMKEALKDKPISDFVMPENCTLVPIDKKTGLRAFEMNENSYMEVFIKGTEPAEFAMDSSFYSSNKIINDIETDKSGF